MRPLPPLYVDDREPVQEGRRRNGIEMVDELKRLGLPAETARLDAADYAFVGEGVGGATARVGIERKRLSDLLQCITDGRFAGEQLPKLRALYDEVWLVVEGVWQDGADGAVEVWERGGWSPYRYGKRWMGKDVRAWLTTMEIKGGVRVIQTSRASTTAQWISSLYWWWRDYDGHKAHHALHVESSHYLNDVGRMAAVMPGVGAEKAVYVQEKFKTPLALANATLSELASVRWTSKSGRKMSLGMSGALRIRAWLRGEEA